MRGKSDASLAGRRSTLATVLDARERRAGRQALALRATGQALACVTLVSPGPEKTGPSFEALMNLAEARLREEFGRRGLAAPLWERSCDATGPVLYASAAFRPGAGAGLELAAELKAACLAVEDARPWGRLVDADVLVAGPSGEILPLRREAFGRAPRACLVCGAEAIRCIASGAHSGGETARAARELREAAAMTTEPWEDRLAVRPEAAGSEAVTAFPAGGPS